MKALVFSSTDTEEQWALPLEVIAKNRADYYAKKDKETTFDEEFKFVMEDDYEAIDWFRNNMDPEDVVDKLFKIRDGIEKDLCDKIRDFECRIDEVNDNRK